MFEAPTDAQPPAPLPISDVDIDVFDIGLTCPSEVDFRYLQGVENIDPGPVDMVNIDPVPLDAAYAVLVLVIPDVDINAVDDTASAVGLGL
ncbi:UNVERIFIED_CONTAM: hypothetical protein K2H54_074553 [Gekko kuhli]